MSLCQTLLGRVPCNKEDILSANASLPCPCFAHQIAISPLQWNLSIKDTLNKGHLSNEDTVCSPDHIELCTNLPLNKGHLSIQDSQLGAKGVLYREVQLYLQLSPILDVHACLNP